MPVKSKTWNTTPGLNYIQDSELAFATIYSVKREGTGHDNYVTGSTNRTYIHGSSSGMISFPNVFNPGERVFAIYKPLNGTEPDPVCIAVGISDSLPDGLVFQQYNKVITLTGTQPFVLSNIVKPAWMTVTNSTNTITLNGTPDAIGSQSVSFDVTNCGGTEAFSDSFEVLQGTVNLRISNSVPGLTITNILNLEFVLVSGIVFPPPFTLMTGVHGAYTTDLQVLVTLSGFPCSMSLLKNNLVQQVVLIPSSNQYAFDLVPPWTLSDDILIQFSS